MVNGLYFVNCVGDNGERRSGIAFYTDEGSNNQNTNEQPAAFAYTDTANRIKWEQDYEQTVTFADGTTLTWKMQLDAQTKAQEVVVGYANNGHQRFTVHKDDQSHLFWNNDGFDCKRIYYAFAN